MSYLDPRPSSPADGAAAPRQTLHPSAQTDAEIPVHDAMRLTGGGVRAQIALAGQIYTLRITRAGGLILTK
jgi:hemin uptake protein HemP